MLTAISRERLIQPISLYLISLRSYLLCPLVHWCCNNLSSFPCSLSASCIYTSCINLPHQYSIISNPEASHYAVLSIPCYSRPQTPIILLSTQFSGTVELCLVLGRESTFLKHTKPQVRLQFYTILTIRKLLSAISTSVNCNSKFTEP